MVRTCTFLLLLSGTSSEDEELDAEGREHSLYAGGCDRLHVASGMTR